MSGPAARRGRCPSDRMPGSRPPRRSSPQPGRRRRSPLLLALLLASPLALLAPEAMGEGLKLDRIGRMVGGILDSGQEILEAVSTIDERREQELGSELAARLLGAVPLVDDPPLEQYVNGVGRWVALQSARPRLRWRFGVLDTNAVNAFAAPGGYVFVTRGLVHRLESEAELAGVLAHEIEHVVRRHHLEAIQAGARRQLAARVAGSLIDDDGRLTELLLSLGMKLYARGLDRADEHEADARGAVLAARAGYDPYGLAVALDRLSLERPDESTMRLFTSTHPPLADRLERLESLFGREPLASLEGRVLAPRFLLWRQRLDQP